jgi:hypothetical protein
LRALALAPALALAALASSGCQTSAEKSAELEKAALRAAARQPAAHGLQITRPSADVKVLATALVRSSEGSAAVVTLRNASSRALRDVPIALEVTDSGGRVVYTNTEAGVARSLTSIPLLAAHGVLSWVDDQVQGAGASVRVKVGQAPPAAGAIPSIAVTGTRLSEEGGGGAGVTGTVSNHSSIAQQELVLFALARKGGRVVAAGRAVLPVLGASSAAHFQVPLIGAAAGARVEVGAPPTTLR